MGRRIWVPGSLYRLWPFICMAVGILAISANVGMMVAIAGAVLAMYGGWILSERYAHFEVD